MPAGQGYNGLKWTFEEDITSDPLGKEIEARVTSMKTYNNAGPDGKNAKT